MRLKCGYVYLVLNGWDEPDSAAQLRGTLSNAVASMLRLGINHSDAARIQWQTAAQKYRERWAQGDLDGVLPVFSDLLTWLRDAKIDLTRNADVVALFNDPAFRELRSRIPAIASDPKVPGSDEPLDDDSLGGYRRTASIQRPR